MKKIGMYLTIILFCGVVGFFFLANLGSLKETIAEQDVNSSEEFIANINAQYPIQFYNKYAFINMNGLAHKILGQNSMNTITKLNNGYLAVQMDKLDVTEQARGTIAFQKALEENNIPFLYVQAPYIVSKYDSQLPRGTSDFSNENADAFISTLEQESVSVLDLRSYFHKKGLDQYSLFFRTDHHWTPEGAFIGFQAVVERMEDMLQVEVDDQYTKIENYTSETYEDWFLGANGKRTGIYFAGVENITLLYPHYETNITLSVPSEGIYREGDFQKSVMDYTNIEEKDYFGKNPYHVYIGDQYPLVQQRNEDAPCDKKVLLIKDSFALPIQAFLSQCFTEVDALDLRLYTELTAWEYVQEAQPDIVLVLYNPYMLSTKETFSFQ